MFEEAIGVSLSQMELVGSGSVIERLIARLP